MTLNENAKQLSFHEFLFGIWMLWPLLLIGLVGGGLVGFGVKSLLPPTYHSKARVAFQGDFPAGHAFAIMDSNAFMLRVSRRFDVDDSIAKPVSDQDWPRQIRAKDYRDNIVEFVVGGPTPEIARARLRIFLLQLREESALQGESLKLRKIQAANSRRAVEFFQGLEKELSERTLPTSSDLDQRTAILRLLVMVREQHLKAIEDLVKFESGLNGMSERSIIMEPTLPRLPSGASLLTVVLLSAIAGAAVVFGLRYALDVLGGAITARNGASDS